MNPENCGPHITGKHSHLWRKSMFIEPKIPDSQLCHQQINEFSKTTNSSWRTRNNTIKTNYSHLSSSSTLNREKLAVDDFLAKNNESEAKKTMAKSLIIDEKALEKSQMLIEGMKKLKDVDLSRNKALKMAKLPGVIRHEYIYNDYHPRTANPGYSRNYKGKFYTK